MQHKRFVKCISVLMCMVLLAAGISAYAADNPLAGDLPLDNSTTAAGEGTTASQGTTSGETTTQDTRPFEEQLSDIRTHIAEMDKLIAEAEKESKGTLEYIDLIDNRIGYLNEELTLYENEIVSLQEKIDTYQTRIDENTKEIEKVEKEVSSAEAQIDQLQEQFSATYELFSARARAMYISGDFSILSLLFTSGDLATLLTRLEMVSEVAMSDADLMQQIENQTDELILKQDGLAQKEAQLQQKKDQLSSDQAVLRNAQNSLTSNQSTLALKKAQLADERAMSDQLLYEYTSKTQMYTEYRNIDEEAEASVQADIEAVINGFDREVTTYDYDDVEIGGGDNGYHNVSGTNAVLNMTYPVPGHTKVSAGFPNYSDGSYHGGIDFPCATGTTVVAAQSGTVIDVKRLTDSYGYYIIIYHGKDANGRSVATLYAHNSSLLVSVGDVVSKGETIARSGSTGNSTGPHCHFEVRINGSRVNPTYYLS